MQRARAIVLGIAFALALAPGARAEDDEEEEEIDPTLSGYYLGVTAGTAIEQFSNGDYDTGQGAGAFAGYRAGEFTSVELQAEFLENFETNRGTNNEVDLWLATLNFRMHIAMGRLEPYITYGAGALGVDSTGGAAGRGKRADIVFKGGGGLAYHLSDALSVFGAATYALPLGSAKKYEHTSFVVGVQYKFEE